MGNNSTKLDGGANLPGEVLMNIGKLSDADTASKIRRTGREGTIVDRPWGPHPGPPPSYPDVVDWLDHRPEYFGKHRYDTTTTKDAISWGLLEWSAENDSLQNRERFIRTFNQRGLNYKDFLFVIHNYVRRPHTDLNEVHGLVTWLLDFLETKTARNNSILGTCCEFLRKEHQAEVGEWFLKNFYDWSDADIRDFYDTDSTEESSDDDDE